MPLRVLLELGLDQRRLAFRGDVHDDAHPREERIGLRGVRRAHRTAAPGRPALFDGRRRSDLLPLDDLLHLLHVTDVIQVGLLDAAARQAVLQHPLLTAALEAQDLGAFL